MKKTINLLLVAVLFAFNAQAQTNQVFTKNNKALNGYDVVAFFKESKPIVGQDNLTFSWSNATWHFSTQVNLDSFKNNPEKYAPQYGGYCAYGCSNGYKAPTQIDTWTIVNNKLYFNYNLKVKDSWVKAKEALIPKADSNWVKIKDKP